MFQASAFKITRDRQHRIPAMILSAVLCTIASNRVSADVILVQDTFTRSGALAGSSPDTGANWSTGNSHATDGSVLNMSATGARANIGFNFVQGSIYSLSVDLDVNDSSGNQWLSMGFTSDIGSSANFGSGTEIWMLQRSENNASADVQTYHSGAAENHNLLTFANDGSMMITLDTTNATDYVATYTRNGVTLRTANVGTPTITGVFLSNQTTGTFDNFQLTSTAVPEPTAGLLSGLAGLVILARRRRSEFRSS